jgi:hypothetical protein
VRRLGTARLFRIRRTGFERLDDATHAHRDHVFVERRPQPDADTNADSHSHADADRNVDSDSDADRHAFSYADFDLDTVELTDASAHGLRPRFRCRNQRPR